MRMKFLPVMGQLLVDMLKDRPCPRRLVVESGALPSDARFVRAGVDPYGDVNLVVESDAWEDVLPGGVIPRAETPVLACIYDEAEGA